MCIVIVCCPVCGVIDFEIYLSFLIKPLAYMTKKSEQKCKYLKNSISQASKVKQKAFFIILKGLLAARNCFRPETVPLFLSWRRSLSYGNQSKSMDCFLYDRDLRHERVKLHGLSHANHLVPDGYCF